MENPHTGNATVKYMRDQTTDPWFTGPHLTSASIYLTRFVITYLYFHSIIEIFWMSHNRQKINFSQGPCASGEWLTINSNESTPLCQKTICPESLDSLKPWFLLNSTCYQLSTRAFCPGENQTVQYGFNDLEPNCFDSPVKPKRTLLNDALTLPCKPGYKKHGSEAKECKASV